MAQHRQRRAKRYTLLFYGSIVGAYTGYSICEAHKHCVGVRFTSWRARHLDDATESLVDDLQRAALKRKAECTF